MKRNAFMISMLMFLGTVPILALADIGPPPPEVIADHPAAFSWVLGVALFFVCMLLGSKLTADAKNNERQWQFISKNADDVTDIKVSVASLKAICESRGNLKKRGDG